MKVLIIALSVGPTSSRAVTPLLEVVGSPDISVLVSGMHVDDDEAVADDLAGSLTLDTALSLPASADVIGLDRLPSGEILFSLDTSVALPGSAGPIQVSPGDVIRFDGATYAFQFLAAGNGVPVGTATDAVATNGADLLLSFDTSIDLGGAVVAEDEDVVLWNGSTLVLFLDTSTFGISPTLDLDAVHVAANGHLLMSFDVGGAVGSLLFEDEDVLELDPVSGAWELAYEASARDSGWAAADLDALFALTDADGDGLADIDEVVLGTNPLASDSDGDGLLDGVETNTGTFIDETDTGTDPLDADSDDDGWSDGAEVFAGFDPTDPASVPPAIPASSGVERLALALLILLLALWAARGKARAQRVPDSLAIRNTRGRGSI